MTAHAGHEPYLWCGDRGDGDGGGIRCRFADRGLDPLMLRAKLL